ncbi:MAG: signal recognition particle protein [Clostridia bacterium]|nr:signal recognition particle protein [Clostridia bacterium]
MAFEGLSEKFQGIINNLKGKSRITENDVKEITREVKLALLEADVNYKVVKDFTNKISEKALGQDVLKSLTPGQQVVKIVHEELTNLLGSKEEKLNLSPNPPTIIMLVGLQGSGKTTMAGKLSNMLRKQGKNPILVACDVYRPAAIDQLEVLGKQLNIPVYANRETKDVLQITREAMKVANSKLNDVIIIDTAGRLHIDETLMTELKNLKEFAKPNEILLVVDSMTGQDAVNVAQSFNEQLEIDGVVLTKLDGDTRGGAALSVKAITGKPIKFAGVGEKMNDIEAFSPDKMARRILGMGDVLSLIEDVEKAFDEKEAEKLEKKIRKADFTMDDYLSQLKQVRKMGSMKSIINKLGLGTMTEEQEEKAQQEFKRTEAIIQSMTMAERNDPSILNAKRRIRIANGSGTTVQQVNMCVKQFDMTKNTMKQVMSNKGNLMKMAGKMGKNLTPDDLKNFKF